MHSKAGESEFHYLQQNTCKSDHLEYLLQMTSVYKIIENTSLMQQDKYIFHLYVFSTCFGRDITHHQELQNCTHLPLYISNARVISTRQPPFYFLDDISSDFSGNYYHI